MLVTFTFVTLMLVMLVTLVTFTLRTYVLLTWYAGTYGSSGASGNQATPWPTPIATLQLRPPTNATSAGAYTGRGTTRPGTQAQPPSTYTQRPRSEEHTSELQS